MYAIAKKAMVSANFVIHFVIHSTIHMLLLQS